MPHFQIATLLLAARFFVCVPVVHYSVRTSPDFDRRTDLGRPLSHEGAKLLSTAYSPTLDSLSPWIMKRGGEGPLIVGRRRRSYLGSMWYVRTPRVYP